MCTEQEVAKAMTERKGWRDTLGKVRRIYGVVGGEEQPFRVLVDHLPLGRPPFIDYIPLSQVVLEDLVPFPS